MDKRGMKRQMKGKGHLPGGEFIMLGSKPSSGNRGVGSESDSSSGSVHRRRLLREGDESGFEQGSGQFSKKGRFEDSSLFSNPHRMGASQATAVSTLVVEVAPGDLLDTVLEEENSGNATRAEAILCGAVKQLRASQGRPEPTLYLALMSLARAKSTLFMRTRVLDEFIGLLRKDLTSGIPSAFKPKPPSQVPILAANIIMCVLQHDRNWPESVAKVYVEDSLGDRMWVDSEHCHEFVDNILTAFATKIPPNIRQLTESIPTTPMTVPVSMATEGTKDSSIFDLTIEMEGGTTTDDRETPSRLTCRFHSPPVKHAIHKLITKTVTELLSSRQAGEPSISRKAVRFFCDVTGYPSVRLMLAQRLEMWLQNPKLTRPAQDLMLCICYNCNLGVAEDVETISHLVRIRIKSKPLASHYVSCIKEMVQQNSQNPTIALRYVIYNELSQTSRNPNNMALISMFFQTVPEVAPKALAGVFQELLTRKEDFLRALRGLFREIVRVLRHEMDFGAFCLSLLEIDQESPVNHDEHGIKTRYVLSVTDLVAVALLLSVTLSVKDAAAAFSKGDKKDVEILRKFHQQAAAMQRDGIWWLHTVVPSLAQLPEKDYTQCVRKILFLEPMEGYYMKDGFPPENERSVLYRLVSEVAVLEDTLIRVLLLGLTDRPLLPQDAQDIVDKMVRRAATVYSTDLPTIPCIEREEFIDTVFRLSAYNYPEGIQLPRDYHPPKLAISKVYWKSWLVLLILSACSPTTIGRIAWINYPTLRCMMEMVITNNYSVSPSGQTDEEKQRDLQIVCQEKEEILQFESCLAAATTKEVITEKSSHLLNQLMRMDPRGPPRKPPPPVIDQLKFAAKRMSLGHRLCKSRDPDFLLSIIQKQGTTQSMTWLVDLIQSSSGSLDLLPVQCLCEFLLLESDEKEKEHAHKRDPKGKREQGIAQQHQLLDRLHSMLMGTEAEVNTTANIIEYFLKRLPSEQPQTRAQGLKGLKLILSGPRRLNKEQSSADKWSFKWLLEELPTLRHFHDIKSDVCAALRLACKVETDTAVVTAYLVFLSQHSMDNDLVGLSLELANIITYRTSLSDRLLSSAENLLSSSTELRDKSLKALISIFVSHLSNALRTSEPPDIEQRELIIVRWCDGKVAFLHWSVIRAMVVLLTRGPPSEDQEQYWQLMEAWFPENDPQPVCFIMQTREQAYIFEQGLKLCMIRSPVSQLVNAALEASALEELLIFVQSFGIPVESMSRLLHKLDETATEQPNALHAVLNDPNSPSDSGYLSRLVDVEQMRGAKGGDIFKAQLIGDETNIPEDESDVDFTDEPLQEKTEMETETTNIETDTKIGSVDWWTDRLTKAFPENGSDLLKEVQQVLRKSSVAIDVSPREKLLPVESLVTSLLQLLQENGPFLEQFTQCQSSALKLVAVVQRSVVDTSCADEWKHVLSKLSSLSLNDGPLSRTVKRCCKEIGVVTKPVTAQTGLDTKAEDDFLSDLKSKDSHTAVRMCLKMMKDQDNKTAGNIDKETLTSGSGSSSLRCQPNSKDFSGLLVDWLERLDPEFSSVDLEQQMDIVFGWCKDPVVSSPGGETKRIQKGRVWQPYLLSSLTHHCSWRTFERCLNHLLSPGAVSRFNPTAVLDVLASFLRSPRIWQGTAHIATGTESFNKNADEEIKLPVDKTQACVVVDYVVKEAKDHGGEIDTIRRRLPLVLSYCGEEEVPKAVIAHVHSIAQPWSDAVLVQLYLALPLIAPLLQNFSVISRKSISYDGPSKLEPLIHRLLTRLSGTDISGVKLDCLKDTHLLCRSLAAAHPALIVRHLSFICGLLNGRLHLTPKEFEHCNHHLFFTWVLGLLDLVRPLLFQCLEEVHDAFQKIIVTYMELMEKQCNPSHNRRNLVTAFLAFLCQFHASHPAEATVLLVEYKHIISELAEAYPDVGQARAMLEFLSSHSLLTSSTSTEQPTVVPFNLTPSERFWTLSQLTPFIKALEEDRIEGVLDVLHDMDNVSSNRVEILEPFEAQLQRLLKSENDECRRLAHCLLLRYIVHNPKAATRSVPAVVKCFNSQNVEIASTALKFFPQYFILSSENRQTLFEHALKLAERQPDEGLVFLRRAIAAVVAKQEEPQQVL